MIKEFMLITDIVLSAILSNHFARSIAVNARDVCQLMTITVLGLELVLVRRIGLTFIGICGLKDYNFLFISPLQQ